jgi:Dyp-type peroxidase family
MTVPPLRPGIEAGDIQGNVLHGYGSALPCARYVPVRIPDADAGRALLGKLRVTGAAVWDRRPLDALNVAISHRGLKALGVPKAVRERFPPEFTDGMEKRAEALGDTGNGAPDNWDPGLRAIELLVILHARDTDRLDHEYGRLQAAAAEANVELADPQDARMNGDAREAFGFADGLSQPALDLAPSVNDAGQGARRFGHERPLRLGEFVLGYRDEDDMLPVAPPAPFARNGTFMVLRKLHQDVDGFKTLLDRLAEHDFNRDRELAAAKLVGRWPDGTPLLLRPHSSPESPAIAAPKRNDFRYADDPRGYACPIGAHVRRANPRDSLHGGEIRTRRHRIIRRGMPYEEGPDRGLVFVCFNASIARQFEVVNRWLRDGGPFGLGRDADPLTVGGTATFQGDVPVISELGDPLVWARGGEYLFLPSLSALDELAAGHFRAP